MKVLALDSSGLVASVAVVEDNAYGGNLLAEYTVNYKKTHSQTLLPMLDEIVKMIELDLESIDAIAVAAGPGSFTGLRIGSATAKGLGLALNKPLAAIPTVDALAFNLYGTDSVICPIMDARRNQVYTGIYEFCGEELHVIEPQMAVGIDEIAKKLCALDRDVIFLGDGVPVFREKLENDLLTDLLAAGRNVSFAPAHLNKQRAGAVATLALQYIRDGRTQTAAEHEPEYLRLSQAERERAEQERAAAAVGQGQKESV
jgi:tRNA threonylcarbamoyladenosine biosynthesis protein TsaB